jgi:hypothetical protein
MNNEKFEYDLLEDLRFLEEKYSHIEKDYQPRQEE